MTRGTNDFSRRTLVVGGFAAAGLAAGTTRSLAQELLRPTPASDIGPFYPIQRLAEEDADLTRIAGRSNRAIGEVIEVTGRILDRHGNPVAGATLDIWQANAAGRYAHPADTSAPPLDPDFQGFAKLRTGADGEWRITTIRPGLYGDRTRHIHFDVAGRHHRLIAQMYFPDEAHNTSDQLFNRLGARAAGSIATAEDTGKYRWNIVLLDA